ncbi:hypothetical protein BAUCODRAFT_148179 [Baudoinia panamericana UAMH 10762]|uniref:Uncharacterized protein n=1 Tax=Baudoinia panamericana (strain UAMH 10762) TaxID=717646 RepID=M2LQB0_BAUPA|nr:uncharacterized protein BAUCODRAFT_148179 [Baudoinia panamericana UAMH 10762]EMC96597.1 hypothetical protein BAUCODRAFT_148179 [Baudoinia panamericana UAMH 10762]
MDQTLPAGILTKTLVRSPVVHWLLHARLRDGYLNDVVFVGSDFIHVKHIGHEGRLQHLATKDDFDAQIRSAKVLNIEQSTPEEELLVKAERGNTSTKSTKTPPDCILLTLSTNDVLFLYLDSSEDGSFQFIHQACPLPRFDRTLFQPGQHLAVDPQSRALAVAALERQVVLYSLKRKDRIQHELQTKNPDWCPVATERQLQVQGVIQHMEFLIPPERDEDHIILLLILTDQRRNFAVYYDWYYTSDIHHAQAHTPHPLSTANTVISLLIPLQNAAFLLISGSSIIRCEDILSGSLHETSCEDMDLDARCAGLSPMEPVWTSWCRPQRNRAAARNKDHIYLIREDGLVFLLHAAVNSGLTADRAGHFDCHVGTAFASLGGPDDPDILAVAGEMSTGRVVAIGHFPTRNGRVNELSRLDTMSLELIQTIPNWASVTDMVATRLPQSHGRSARSRDGLFVTSGREPYGSITELRFGLEARLSTFFTLENLHVVTSMWSLPLASDGSLLIVLATPTSTRFLQIPEDDDPAELGPDDVSALDADYRTLAAASTVDTQLVQVTDKGIAVTGSLIANFEDTIHRRCTSEETIVAAVIDTSFSRIYTAEVKNGECILCATTIPPVDAEDSDVNTLDPHKVASLPSPPLALAVDRAQGQLFMVVATAEDGILCLTGDSETALSEACRISTNEDTENRTPCDNLAILCTTESDRVLVVCGLRDGRLLCSTIEVDQYKVLRCADTHVSGFSHSSVRLASLPGRPHQAYAMSSTDTCLLSWTGGSAKSMIIDNIWVVDKEQPELAQGQLSACAQWPPPDHIDSDEGETMMLVMGDEFMMVELDRMPSAVARQLPVSGTPTRVIYAEQHRSLVVASIRTTIRTIPTAASRAEEKRQIWPAIDFIPSRANEPSFTFDMQPGERVFSLLEWSFTADNKTYSFVLIGGSYIRRSGAQGGRVTFLQPRLRNWEVVTAEMGTVIKLDDPVYALSLFDELTFVVCYGTLICLYRFDSGASKWEPLCVPYKLASPGVYVSVDAAIIAISTMSDSLVRLRLSTDRTEAQGRPRLRVVETAPQGHSSLSHLILDLGDESKPRLSLLSTKYGQLVGMTAHPTVADGEATLPTASNIIFEARSPRSFMRLRQANVRPKWKPSPPTGVLLNDIVAAAVDGTLIGVAVLDERLWRRLSWLQRLCEWNGLISPHSYESPLYDLSESGFARDQRALPMGFSSKLSRNEIVVRTTVPTPVDKHIDGDVLARLFSHGGARTLRTILRQTAEREDRIGAWMREHLDEELDAVDDMMSIVQHLLDGWL